MILVRDFCCDTLTFQLLLLIHLENVKVVVQINPYPAQLIYLNFHLLEVVSRYRDPQLQVGENYSYLFNLKRNILNLDV